MPELHKNKVPEPNVKEMVYVEESKVEDPTP